jgi:hypothetical protein
VAREERREETRLISTTPLTRELNDRKGCGRSPEVEAQKLKHRGFPAASLLAAEKAAISA